jgi:DNA-binding GntR family transcriptional regulator
MTAKSPTARGKMRNQLSLAPVAEPELPLYSGHMGRKSNTQHGVRDLSIREKAYHYIQQLIANGTLPAGSGISELLLAKELGSSRTPIREAMNQLQAEGLLTQTPRGGMVVAQLNREDIIELYEMREALEVYVAGKIAQLPLRPTDRVRLQAMIDEVARLEKELARSKKPTLDEKQMERFISCDLGFHALLMSMANNSRLQKILNDTRLLISVFAIHRGGHDAASLKSIREYHQMVLDAVARQDSDAAKSALSKHIEESRQERLSEFDEWRRESSLRGSLPAFFDVHTMDRLT